MPVYETFAKRKREAEQSEQPTVFRQDELPKPFRVQVAHIWDGTIGDPSKARTYDAKRRMERYWAQIHNTLCREMGVLTLWNEAKRDIGACKLFLMRSQDVDEVLSLVEISFAFMQSGALPRYSRDSVIDAIKELNVRFREHAIGYQFQGGQIISVESQYLHTQTVEPAISLLYEARFEGPLQEFMQAHEHFRKGNHKDAIVNAQNAFESTMKAICDQQGWAYVAEKATAQNLLKVLFDNGLIPAEMQSHFTALRSTLESGLPTVRNRGGRGGHGQGADVVEVPDYLAAYSLHLAATNIVLLIEARNASK